MGRPKAEPQLTPAQVEGLAAIGCADDEIAVLAGISENTLKRTFGPQLKRGRSNLKIRVRKKQLERAEQGDTGMLIWLGKVYLGQSDKQTNVNIDVSQLSDDELRAILKA